MVINKESAKIAYFEKCSTLIAIKNIGHLSNLDRQSSNNPRKLKLLNPYD
ncbi:Uncharacterised protein [Legionella pneumophila]|nr:Uncharacterised protein [Legionella pneumophila]CZH06075.1 Uncharacterised protein [Legionella pneumophila]CZH54096.1 Uncharacterised protein [Legionella pneumophila]CZH94383.1 Uncharacterised protein [Legionella pneumophila]CZM21509.1 Uncharacterised protein [Legionella pneumophila]